MAMSLQMEVFFYEDNAATTSMNVGRKKEIDLTMSSPFAIFQGDDPFSPSCATRRTGIVPQYTYPHILITDNEAEAESL